MNLFNLKIGDLIVRDKGPFSAHFIVYVGIKNGEQIVAENQRGVGVRYTTLKNALAGNTIRRFEKFGGTEMQRHLVIPRINQLLGQSYDLVIFNCEHFARWIANGKVESKQVKITSMLVIVAGATMLASNNIAVKAIGVLGIIGGAVGLLSQK